MTELTLFMLIQMSGPRDIVIYWPGPRAFSVVHKLWGWAPHFGAKAPGCPGGMVTGQIDTCIRPFSTYNYKSYIFHTWSEFWRARRKINVERKRRTWKLHRLLFSWLLDQVRTFWAILELLALVPTQHERVPTWLKVLTWSGTNVHQTDHRNKFMHSLLVGLNFSPFKCHAKHNTDQ